MSHELAAQLAAEASSALSQELLSLAGPYQIDATITISTELGQWTADSLPEALQKALTAYQALERGRPGTQRKGEEPGSEH